MSNDKPDPEEFRKLLDDELDSNIKNNQSESSGVKSYVLFFIIFIVLNGMIASPAIVYYFVGFEQGVITGFVAILFLLYNIA